MPKFRKKPVVIEAFCFCVDQAPEWWREAVDSNAARVHSWKHLGATQSAAIIKTLEGEMWGQMGDFIIRGVEGELYPCKPGIFAATYELVEDQETISA